MKRWLALLFLHITTFAVANISAPAIAQLRIVTYNVATDTNPAGDVARAGMSTVLQGIGIEDKNGIERPLDVLALQETTTTLGGANSITALLNSLYGAGTYADSTIVGSSTDGTTEAVIYNTKTVQLIAQTQVGFASTTGAARAPLRFEFRPVGGYTSSADFYVYTDHYKAGTAASDQTRRNTEAIAVRADADSLGAGAKIIFAGDYNIESSNETMYQTITATGGPGRALDPLQMPGNWYSNSAFAAIHSQAPLNSTPAGSSLTGGGLDDRFDFQLQSAGIETGQGVSYIGPSIPNLSVAPSQNSYHTFGNNGSVGVNGNINDSTSTALPASEYSPGPGQPTRIQVLNALTTASDHLPVVADYQIPAKLNVVVTGAPNQVIIGGSASVNVAVANTAPVAVAIGADELVYNGSGSGAVAGTLSGTINALAPANNHPLTLDTSILGPRSGTINVSTSSQAAASSTLSQSVNFTVLDHAAPEFQSPSAPKTLNINFGTVPQGSGTAEQAFRIENLPATYRAGLDLNGVLENGDFAGRFSTDATTFSDLAPGALSDPYDVFLDTSLPGSYSATYTFSLADQAGLVGGSGGETLTLNVSGVIAAVPEPSGASLSIGATACLAMIYFGRRLRRTKA